MDPNTTFFDLPFTNPTLIFFIVLSIILLAPIFLNKIKVPHIIGLILAGVVVGPYGLGILMRDTSFELFGKVGLLYLMFLAGLEMDMNDFRKNRSKGIIFGLYTFLIPMLLGTLSSYYLLHFSMITSILLASMFASHTLVAYPIIGRYGVAKTRSVTITIAGTILTVLLALLILAVITGMYKGSLNTQFWIRFGLSIIIYGVILFALFPPLARWFLRKYDDNVSQFIFVLSLVFAASFAAELSGLEGIIGAFIAGVVLNRYIPPVSPLMNRIEFVGNALFIPYFLIGVGMLVDLRVLFNGTEALVVALTMSVVATLSKWIAAWMTQKTFKLSQVERKIIFGLSNGQAAATLAAVLIGYNIITGISETGEPIRLLNENILNGTILMILITCTISSIVTENAAKELATESSEEHPANEHLNREERILIPVANPSTIDNLVKMALLMKNPKQDLPLYALFVNVDKDKNGDSNQAKSILEKVVKIGAATDTEVKAITRYDVNIASGIIHTIKENHITDIVVGFHHKANIADTFFGVATQSILKATNRMLLIVKGLTPIHTINKIVVAVPAKAEFETGFERWIERIANISSQMGCRVIFYSNQKTETCIRELVQKKEYNFRIEYEPLDNWQDFIDLKEVVQQHDLFVIVSARHTSISYHHAFEKLPFLLSHHFNHTNLMVIYPDQFNTDECETFFSDPQAIDIQKNYPRIDLHNKWLKNVFKRKK